MKLLSQSATEIIISQTRGERAYADLYWRVSSELARASEWRANIEPKPIMPYGYLDYWRSKTQDILEVSKWSI